VGNPNDVYVKKWGGRVETFDIAADEQLIGCKLDHDDRYFRGLTWIKMKKLF
jgi:hypothetical protein